MPPSRFLYITKLDYRHDLVEHHERCGCLFGRRTGQTGIFIMLCPRHMLLQQIVGAQAPKDLPVYTRFDAERRMACAEEHCRGNIIGFVCGWVSLDFYEMDAFLGLCQTHIAERGIMIPNEMPPEVRALIADEQEEP